MRFREGTGLIAARVDSEGCLVIPVDGSGKGNVRKNLAAFHISLFVMALQQSSVGLESREGGECMYCVCRALSVVSESANWKAGPTRELSGNRHSDGSERSPVRFPL